MVKVFITNHAFSRITRAAGMTKAQVREAVSEIATRGDLLVEAPDWYTGGKAGPDTRFALLSDNAVAVTEPNPKTRRRLVVTTIVNRRAA